MLTLILFLPAVSAILLLFLPRDNKDLARRAALVLSLVPFILSLVVWFGFGDAAEVDGFRYTESAVWYAAINSTYHIGIDGLSLSMVLLTTLLTPLAIGLAVWRKTAV